MVLPHAMLVSINIYSPTYMFNIRACYLISNNDGKLF